MLRWGLPDAIQLAAIVVSNDGQGTLSGVPVVSLSQTDALGLDSILLSSATYETEMMERALESGIPNILGMYQDWPANMFGFDRKATGAEDTRWQM